jgi:prepilin-type N-terminal cleavage/methylation domain-containing protein
MRYAARGFSLVELMISMLLGLVIIGAATGVILANRQSYRTNEGLSQIQESARTAFEQQRWQGGQCLDFKRSGAVVAILGRPARFRR